MVTFELLIEFTTLIVAIISLVVNIFNTTKKK